MLSAEAAAGGCKEREGERERVRRSALVVGQASKFTSPSAPDFLVLLVGTIQANVVRLEIHCT